ncbi:Pls/PosA family non-ribosomal peptide synthetase [Nocardia coffeae]|uniref:Pls/PosA family non-ribosomal peptide synthetase n=1 Tax=Nocardia coffeae TaxID=2873381 RepID=UPI0027DFE9B5|nr:Pls/PosA family non-ribosomal peptide synthetase [Nocardia coffeae]
MPRSTTLLDVLNHSVCAWPDEMAIDDGEHRLSYRRLDRVVRAGAGALRMRGIQVGDRVGVRMASGSTELYVAILTVLAAGAAYVPVDADDPDERAELIWQEAGVRAVLGADGGITVRELTERVCSVRELEPGDDAWIIFTSGSTGKAKAVAVSHRSAAAFADAEARLFLRDAPIGPGDRVLAGLSVAFDASCEEMWLAWRHGACLVPVSRSLVRTGADLGPWLVRRRITVVSTVPSLAALWSPEMLAGVRLLIVGGEPCPPEVVRRFADDDREVWNTYGPTEATVVSCAARLRDGEPVRIGLPLDGWQLAVVGEDERPVRWGEVGELVVGGVGLGRYLDPARDAEKFAPLPTLGWARAYRSGDLVRAHREGLEFVGRRDDQVKIGGRRIELGEIEDALLDLPSVVAAITLVKHTAARCDVLVGYVVPADGDPQRFDRDGALRILRERLPAALVPRLALLSEFPTRASGKVDRAALPWPLPADPGGQPADTDETTAWLCGLWHDMLGTEADAYGDFFDLGGTSLTAARLVSMLRERYPEVSVADVYRYPTPAALRLRLVCADQSQRPCRTVSPIPLWTRAVQTVIQLLLLAVSGVRWVVAVALIGNVYSIVEPESWLPRLPWSVLVPALLVLSAPPGRVLVAGLGARVVRGRITPGSYRRGGRTHLRLWAAERLVASFGLASIVGTPLAVQYARLLGCHVGKDVDLHALPPVTGLATIGTGAAVEPRVDLAGWWLDGDLLRVGSVHVGAGARVGSRSTVMPDTEIEEGAQVLPGSCVMGAVPAGQCWVGSPASGQGSCVRWPFTRPARPRRWLLAFMLAPGLRELVGAMAAIPVVLLGFVVIPADASASDAAVRLVVWLPVMVVLGLLCQASATVVMVRLAGRALRPGTHPMFSAAGWAALFVHELLETSHKKLFPLYVSLFTPIWLRALGARIGRSVELSTVQALPQLLRVADSAFLADDVLVAPYELRGGWMRLGRSRVGARGFVGNSGIVGPGKAVGDNALIGVLSDTPDEVPEGTSWLGRPPIRLRRNAEQPDPARTFAPRRALVLARALVELCRVVPFVFAELLGLATFGAFVFVWDEDGVWLAVLAGGGVLFVAGVVAGASTTLAKWVLIGRFSSARHPLWSSFVWRKELYDVFVEMLAVPWLVTPAIGTPTLNWWLRSLGARLGRGVWCEAYSLPEPDLVEVASGVSVNRGCVLQTHLFHDRVMRLDRVHLDRAATLGPHSIMLPGSTIGEAATVGAASLVMAAESVPGQGRWQGAPITSVR